MNLRGRKIFLATLALLFLFTVYDLTAQQNVPAAKTFQDKESLAENTYLRQRQRFEKIEPQLAQQSSVKVNKLLNETRNLLSQLQTAHSAGMLETKENQQKLYQLNKNLRVLRQVAKQKNRPQSSNTANVATIANEKAVNEKPVKKENLLLTEPPQKPGNEEYLSIAESKMPELSTFVQSAGNPKLTQRYNRLEVNIQRANNVKPAFKSTEKYQVLMNNIVRDLQALEILKRRAEVEK